VQHLAHTQLVVLGWVTVSRRQLSLAIPPWVGTLSKLLYQRKLGDKHTLTPCDALALYPWSCSVNWCLADC